MKRKNRIILVAAVLVLALSFLLVSCQKKENTGSIVKTALPAPCASQYEKTTDNSHVNVDFCDCNALGVVLHNSGATTSCFSHVLAKVPEKTYASFDELGSAYVALSEKIRPAKDVDYRKVVCGEGDEITSYYEDFVSQAEKTFSLSELSVSQKTVFPLSDGVIVGVNKKYITTCKDKYSYNESLLIAANLFGYKNTSTFQTYAQKLVGALPSAAKTTEEARVSVNGAIYTESGAYVFPYIVRCESTPVFSVCMIIERDGTMSVWIADQAYAATAVDFAKRLSTTTKVELLGRCRLFETASGFYGFSFSEGAKDIPGTYAKVRLSTTDGLSKDLTFYLLPEYAPKTVENFSQYAQSGFYNGTAVHRVENGVCLQGGTYVQTGGSTNYGYAEKENKTDPITGEFATNGYAQNVIGHKTGVISMARGDAKDSATAGFFICAGECSGWDGSYAAFGFLPYQEDIDFVEKLANETKTSTVTFGGKSISIPTSRLITIDEVSVFTVGEHEE